MMKEYKLISILHSGQKGERGTPVTQEKYGGMVGSLVILNTDEINIGDSFTFWFENHPFHKWWETSTVQGFEFRDDGRMLVIETINSIYAFINLGEFVFQRKNVIPDCLRGVVCV